jgi:hypothetical protein
MAIEKLDIGASETEKDKIQIIAESIEYVSNAVVSRTIIKKYPVT